LAGYPSTLAHTKALDEGLAAPFAPTHIVVLDVPNPAAYALRQSGLQLNLPTNTTTTEADRTAKGYVKSL
jgi:hypothetical protein